jgi:hypothetical protein
MFLLDLATPWRMLAADDWSLANQLRSHNRLQCTGRCAARR